MNVSWVTVFIDLPAGEHQRASEFWAAVTRSTLSPVRGEHGEFATLIPASGDAYLRLIPRTEMDIAVVGAGVALTLDAGGTCTAARVSVGAVAPTALLVEAAGAALVGSKLDAAALAKMEAAVAAACKPISDKRGTVEYRTKVASVLARRAVGIAQVRASA